jgi:hypothetical protein
MASDSLSSRGVQLRTLKDWGTWLLRIQSVATVNGVWQYINPDLEDIPSPPTRPKKPNKPEFTDEMSDQARAILIDQYKVDTMEYGLSKRVHEQRTAGLNAIRKLVDSTVDAKLLEESTSATLAEQLKKLKKQIDPIVGEDLQEQWNQIMQENLAGRLDEWIDNVRANYQRRKLLGSELKPQINYHEEVMQSLCRRYPTEAFVIHWSLRSVKELPEFEGFLEKIRREISWSEEQSRKRNKRTNSKYRTAFSTFQGKGDKSDHSRKPPSNDNRPKCTVCSVRARNHQEHRG